MDKSTEQFNQLIEGGCAGQTVTLTEVCIHWQKNRKTVQMHVWKGHISGRVAFGGQWLINLSDVIAMWGQPTIPFEVQPL